MLGFLDKVAVIISGPDLLKGRLLQDPMAGLSRTTVARVAKIWAIPLRFRKCFCFQGSSDFRIMDRWRLVASTPAASRSRTKDSESQSQSESE